MVHSDHALENRADEEVRSHRAQSSRTVAQLLPGPQAVLQRHYRRAQQQSQSQYEKSLRLSNLPGHRTRALSCAWQITRAETRPQVLLTNLYISMMLPVARGPPLRARAAVNVPCTFEAIQAVARPCSKLLSARGAVFEGAHTASFR